MSLIDMAYLQKSDLKDGILTYKRRKTGQKLSIEWEPFMRKVVGKYRNADSPYLLNIIKDAECDTRKQYQKALANVNRNLKRLGKTENLKTPLTMYVARHSWESASGRMDIPIAVISEGLGHDNEVTTSIDLSIVGSEAIGGALSSTSPGVNMKFKSSPFSLHIRCSLNPKKQPIKLFPRAAIPLKTLCI